MRRMRLLLLTPALLALLTCVVLLNGVSFADRANIDRPLLTATPTSTPAGWLFLPLILQARIRSSTAVTGTVVLQDGACCVGGIAGEPLTVRADFTAASQAGAVTGMRVVYGYSCRDALNRLVYEPWMAFVAHLDFFLRPPINWSTFAVGAQFQDNHGNVSPAYCDDIAVEGMPPPSPTITPTPPPTPTPTITPTPPQPPTATPTPTSTETPTGTTTATATGTPTETTTPTQTPTVKATQTQTYTPTPSATSTAAPTPSPSNTPTSTFAPTLTRTATTTSTAVPTATKTPTRTSTPLSTATATTRPTPTATIRVCCRYCTPGVSRPCGDSCIPWNNTCHQPPGCACSSSIGATSDSACGEEIDLSSGVQPEWLGRIDSSKRSPRQLLLLPTQFELD